jgi:hypothetical protein
MLMSLHFCQDRVCFMQIAITIHSRFSRVIRVEEFHNLMCSLYASQGGLDSIHFFSIREVIFHHRFPSSSLSFQDGVNSCGIFMVRTSCVSSATLAA